MLVAYFEGIVYSSEYRRGDTLMLVGVYITMA